MANTLLDKIIASLSADALKYFFPGYEPEDVIVPCPEDNCAASAEIKMLAEPVLESESIPEPESAPAIAPAQIPGLGQELESDLELDPRTQAFFDEIQALQEKYGITIHQLEALLSYKVKLSHLRITRNHTIFLDDFDHQEVKMDALTKAVFLLYLKHPEGIRYKDLCDHRRELEDIYMSISGRSNLEGMRKSIEDLTNPVTSNSINEKVSKEKKAFRDVVDIRIAKFYFIEGKQGTAKRIPLDRSLVIWE